MKISGKILVTLLLTACITCKKEYYTLKPKKFKGNGRCQFVSKFYSSSADASLKLELEVTGSPSNDVNPTLTFGVYILDKIGYKAIKTNTLEPGMAGYCDHKSTFATHSYDLTLNTALGTK